MLLISGGESLDNEEKVCKYNAGTDTNPIFLFNLANIENAAANAAGEGGGDEAQHAAAAGFAECGGFGGVDADGGEVAAVAAALKDKVEAAARLPDIQGGNSVGFYGPKNGPNIGPKTAPK